jgi:tetratricopeptide (TPR) repeat protein
LLVINALSHRNTLAAESELFNTMELAQMAGASDVGSGTLETIEEAVELLCRAYPITPAATLKERTKQRLEYVLDLLKGRVTLDQHRELLVQAGWLAALLGCLHYDLGEREPAEAARQAAFQWGKQTGHGELMGWAYEMSAWFALTEGRFEDVVQNAKRGQGIAGTSNAMIQLTLQEAKGEARLGHQTESRKALERGAEILGKLPTPTRPDHHFVFDHTKWIFYAATIYTWQSDDERAEEHAQEIIDRHSRPDGTSNAPMRTAGAQIDLAIVNARRGDLDEAVGLGLSAFDFERRSLGDLISRGEDLDRVLRTKYRREKLAHEFHEQLMTARRALNERRPDLLD